LYVVYYDMKLLHEIHSSILLFCWGKCSFAPLQPRSTSRCGRLFLDLCLNAHISLTIFFFLIWCPSVKPLCWVKSAYGSPDYMRVLPTKIMSGNCYKCHKTGNCLKLMDQSNTQFIYSNRDVLTWLDLTWLDLTWLDLTCFIKIYLYNEWPLSVILYLVSFSFWRKSGSNDGCCFID
jgi:hypothetical protein